MIDFDQHHQDMQQGIRQRKSGKYLYFQYRGGGCWHMLFV